MDLEITIGFITKYDQNTETSTCSQMMNEEFNDYYGSFTNQNLFTTADIINTPGLSFDITYVLDSGTTDQNSIRDGKTVGEWVVDYLTSWGPNVFAGGLVVNAIITFRNDGDSGILGTAAPLGGTLGNNNPQVRNNFFIPDTYDVRNSDTDTVFPYANTTFTRAIAKYWGIIPPDSNADMLVTVNTYYMGDDGNPDRYDYTDNFTNNLNKLSFKGFLIHELHHGLGVANNMVNGISASLLVFSNYRNALLPSTYEEYIDGQRERIGTQLGTIPIEIYGPISISHLALCSSPMDNNSPSHLLRTLPSDPPIGIMEPVLHYGGSPWTENDGNLLAVVGWMNSMACCFSGSSNITVKLASDDVIKTILVSDLISGQHLVYDINQKKYVPVIYNAVMKPVKFFTEIQKDSISENVPNENLYITGGHTVMYKGQPTKANKIPGATRVKTKPQNVYTICTNEQCVILVNNLPVLTWSQKEWIAKTRLSQIFWYDNYKQLKT